MAFSGIFQIFKNIKPEIKVNFNSSDATDKMLVDIVNMFSDTGFTNIQLKPAKELNSDKRFDEGKVKSITIDGKKNFNKGDKFKSNAKIVITYYALKEIQFPFSAEDVVGKSKDEVLALLNDAGFLNVRAFASPYQWIFPDDAAINVQFGDSKNVEKGVLVRPDVLVIVYFNSKNGIG